MKSRSLESKAGAWRVPVAMVATVATVAGRRGLATLAAFGCVTLAAGCGREHGGSTAGAPAQPERGVAAIIAVPLGDVAGAAKSLTATTPNPYANDPQAVQQGHELFIKMNCAGCHGYGAKGAMGPNLTDSGWRYGGVPASIFSSIYEGRPQGMPAWNPALPPQDIWKIVAYIQSLGGTYPADQYQASLQGDRRGDNVPASVAGADVGGGGAQAPAGAPAPPSGGSANAPTVAPQPDISLAPGAQK